MYNQEIKERFLAEFSAGKNEKSCRSKFEAIGSYEEAIGKDLAEMSTEDAIKAMSCTRMGTYGSAFSLVSQIRAYVRWCEANMVFSGINSGLVAITVDDVDVSESMGKLLFKNEHELIDELRKIRPFDDGYYDVVVMLLSWLGITQEQVLEIRTSDVDLDNMVIYFDNRVINIPASIGEVLTLYSKTKRGTRLNKNGPRDVFRDDSYDTFVRKFVPQKQLGNKLSKANVRDAVHDLNAAYMELGNEPRFTSGNVVASGALYRILELERSGVDVFSIKNKAAVVDAFRVSDKLYEIIWLYKNYKRAFIL